MELKLTLIRPGGASVDIEVSADPAATIGTLADTIRRCEPAKSIQAVVDDPTIEVLEGSHFRALSRDALVAESPVRSGAHVSVVPASRAAEMPEPVVGALVGIAGPVKGQSFPLTAGSLQIGRSPSCDLTLDDPLVSGVHARLQVSDTIEIVDLNSSNGIEISGEVVSRAQLQDEDVLVLGSSALQVHLEPAAERLAADRSVIEFVRSPRLDPQYAGEEIEAPEVPERPPLPRPPIIALIVPLLMGGVLFAVTRSATSVIFIAMMPILMLGTFIESTLAGKRAYRRRVEQFHEDLADLEQRLLLSSAAEQQGRLAEQPSTQACIEASEVLDPLLWSRRAEQDAFLRLRVGTGAQESRNRVKSSGAGRGELPLRTDLAEVVGRYREVPGVPVVVNLREVGNLGIAVGSPGAGLPVAYGCLAQLLVLHAPTDVVLTAMVSLQGGRSWEWLKWLPHASEGARVLGVPPLAATSPSCATLYGALVDLLIARQGSRAAGQPTSEIPRRAYNPADLPVVVVLVEDDAPFDRALLVRLAEEGPDVGIHLVWVAPSVTRIPAACRAFVDSSASGPGQGADSAGLVHRGEEVLPLAVEPVDHEAAVDFARSLAPVVDAAALQDEEAALPSTVNFVTAAGYELAESPTAVVERWRESGSLPDPAVRAAASGRRREGSLRAWVGSAVGESLYLDLRLHGPHALVGGTTGAGKSEFLQTWIVGMATAHSPSRVNFLFVDYKGGSAFADCVNLPHTVGLVTDLSPHLVTRALASLNAELRHREHILNRKRAKDLIELERRGDPDAPPSLVIVVDEFAALVQEVPAFVDGVVNVAQRGRSLGLHLVLATQRPAGVIKDNLRANTNLRIALRMADESDSTDVVGTPVAASFSPSLPGRALAKTGPARIVPFQAGYVGGWTRKEPDTPKVTVRTLGLGGAVAWPEPPQFSVDTITAQSPTDLQRIVTTVSSAARVAEVPQPRKPWLPELGDVYDLAQLPSERTDRELVFGVADDPDRQAQPTVAFAPDRDGSMAVFGTGGSGKSTFLRSLAVAAAITPQGGPCEVYAIDGGGRGLAMLEPLPHVGSVIAVDDEERVDRLISFLRATIDDRAARYAAVSAGSISEYRELANRPEEARILVLVDNFGAFRQTYEIAHSRIFERLQTIAADGRQAGVHVVVSADRPGAIPSSLASAIQRRLVLRLANDQDESLLGVPRGVLGVESPAGRGVLEGMELQVAVLGGSANVAQQAEAVSELAAAMGRAGRPAARPIERLPERIEREGLPISVGGLPTLGVDSATLKPIGFVPQGVFIVAGPPQSGRTTTVVSMIEALRRWQPRMSFAYFGSRRSRLAGHPGWSSAALSVEEAATVAADLAERMRHQEGQSSVMEGPRTCVVIESMGEWSGSPAESALSEMIKAARQSGDLVIVEGESSAFASNFGFMQAVKADRAGIALQPEQADGDAVFRTPFGRLNRREFPPGRGLLVRSGQVSRVQVALDA